jgi:hypothetical protein
MGYLIRSRSLLVSHYLRVKDWGIVCMETAAITGKKKYKFNEIDFVLMSSTNVLSIQVGQRIFSIQTKPNKTKHQAAIQKLLLGVRGSHQSAGGFPVEPMVGEM